MNFIIYYLIIFFSILLIIKPLIIKIQYFLLLNKYKIVIDYLDYFLDKAYNVIYNEYIITYTAQGEISIPQEELETIERNFIKLTLDLIGPNMLSLLLSFYTDKEILINNIILYFKSKLETDEIAKLVRTQNQENPK